MLASNILNVIFGVNICGFCGQNSCENKLKQTSAKGDKSFYLVEWKKTPTFSTRNQCSNHLNLSNICEAAIWIYNANMHYSERHPEIECPQFISKEEEKKMK